MPPSKLINSLPHNHTHTNNPIPIQMPPHIPTHTPAHTNNTTNKGMAIKTEDHGSSLKEKVQNAEAAINKSIFMKTANFLVKHNAFSVRYYFVLFQQVEIYMIVVIFLIKFQVG